MFQVVHFDYVLARGKALSISKAFLVPLKFRQPKKVCLLQLGLKCISVEYLNDLTG